VLVEHRQRDVGQQRRDDAALRSPGVGVLAFAEFCEDPGLQERFHQGQDPLILDPLPDAVHHRNVLDLVEARMNVRVQNPPIPMGSEEVDLSDGVLSSPVGPESVSDRLEVGLEDWLQHQLQRCLNDPVGDGGTVVSYCTSCKDECG
jgi:hypothetical protein